jgi:hypothetical protein
MKFYRMMNGDVVTGVQLVMGAPALKATKVFDGEKQSYCFTTCLYREGVKERLNTAQKTVLANQLNKALSLAGPSHEDSLTACGGITLTPLTDALTKLKGKIHDYTK